jgi:hypothetical protein
MRARFDPPDQSCALIVSQARFDPPDQSCALIVSQARFDPPDQSCTPIKTRAQLTQIENGPEVSLGRFYLGFS